MNILNKTLAAIALSGISSIALADLSNESNQAEEKSLSELELERAALKSKMQRYDEIETAIRLKTKEKELFALQHDINMMKKEAQPKPPAINLEELEAKHKKQMKEAVDQALTEEKEKHRSTIKQLKQSFEREKKQLENRIKELQDEITYLNSKEKDLSAYVVKISGIGKNIKATVFYNNRFVERTVGQTISPGMVVDEIRPDGILIATEEGSVFAPLVNNDTAYVLGNKHIVHKILKDQEKKGGGSGGGSAPSLPSPGPNSIPLFGFPQPPGGSADLISP